MSVSLPPSTNVPWKPDAIAQALRDVRGADTGVLVEYIKLLVQHIDQSYSEVAGAVNRLNTELQALKTRYDAHNSHPPPA